MVHRDISIENAIVHGGDGDGGGAATDPSTWVLKIIDFGNTIQTAADGGTLWGGFVGKWCCAPMPPVRCVRCVAHSRP